MSQSVTLAIGETSVRQLDGLFSLNDLHTSAGGEAKHQPAKFTALESTKALVAEIGNSPDSESLRITIGRNGGTYACRELVIAYAAWISAAFHLKVIRVFLAQQQAAATPVIAPPVKHLPQLALPAPEAPDRIKAALEAANTVASQVQAEVFNGILNGQESWKHGRWLASFDYKANASATRIEPDAVVMSIIRLAQAINEPNGMLVNNVELTTLLSACSTALARRFK